MSEPPLSIASFPLSGTALNSKNRSVNMDDGGGAPDVAGKMSSEIKSYSDFGGLLHEFRQTRARTEQLVRPLQTEDMVVQSMEDASPTKWHLAHTTWFFETFVLAEHCPDYQLFHPDFPYLFNSYYVQAGPRFSRPRRGMITRPTVETTMEYRHYVDRQMGSFLAAIADDASLAGAALHDAALHDASRDDAIRNLAKIVSLGINHEQQHQELLMTDVKHLLYQNPLRPAYAQRVEETERESSLSWIFFEEGIHEVGLTDDGGFMFDNEGPRHRVFLESFWLADRLSTASEFLEFVKDGGYERPELWLSAGWAAVESGNWKAPFYWEVHDGEWHEYTFNGLVPLRLTSPVCHVSYFEADAFARWAKARLPTEFEWEIAASPQSTTGNFVESGSLMPSTSPETSGSGPGRHARQMFGDVWEWTRSQYSPYPRYAPVEGAIGEYNGKFMCNQFVLRGGSCVTPNLHIRPTYRNFFPPEARWQFAGIRLASDVSWK